MTGLTIALPDPLWQSITAALDSELESAAVLTARLVDGPDDTLTLLARHLTWVPDDAYLRRDPDQLVIASPGCVPALGASADDDSGAIFVHTHPGAPAQPSPLDQVVDDQLAGPFRTRTRQRWYSHLIVGGTPDQPEVHGTAIDDQGRTLPLRAVRVVGPRLRILVPTASAAGDDDAGDGGGGGDPATFDRQIRAFGPAGQRLLRALHVGVVGAGGTGSAVIEDLARLGVGALTILDPKNLTAGNVTRVHGSGIDDIDRPKTEVAADHLARIGLGTQVAHLNQPVTVEEAARMLRHCDVVFGCTDDNAGRLVLSRHGYWYLAPVIDLGVIIDRNEDLVAGIYGRITTIGPAAACLLCRGRIDMTRARVEALTPDEHSRLSAEGYIPGQGEPDPAVVAFTSLVAAHATAELLQRLFGYGPTDLPTEQILHIDRHRISLNTAAIRPGCYCDNNADLGAGDTSPHLDLIWT